MMRNPTLLISFETIETPLQTDIIRQPSPPPVLADLQNLIPRSIPITKADYGMENSLPESLVSSEPPLQLLSLFLSLSIYGAFLVVLVV